VYLSVVRAPLERSLDADSEYLKFVHLSTFEYIGVRRSTKYRPDGHGRPNLTTNYARLLAACIQVYSSVLKGYEGSICCKCPEAPCARSLHTITEACQETNMHKPFGLASPISRDHCRQTVPQHNICFYLSTKRPGSLGTRPDAVGARGAGAVLTPAPPFAAPVALPTPLLALAPARAPACAALACAGWCRSYSWRCCLFSLALLLGRLALLTSLLVLARAGCCRCCGCCLFAFPLLLGWLALLCHMLLHGIQPRQDAFSRRCQRSVAIAGPPAPHTTSTSHLTFEATAPTPPCFPTSTQHS
jgi:hypothetical protein